MDDRGSRRASLRRGGVEEAPKLGERFRATADALDRGVYTLETLEYLIRGGRVGRAAGLASQLLDAKPVIELREGENEAAADRYAEIGAGPDEAYTRLRAAAHLSSEAREQANAQVSRALRFFEAVGATAYADHGASLVGRR